MSAPTAVKSLQELARSIDPDAFDSAIGFIAATPDSGIWPRFCVFLHTRAAYRVQQAYDEARLALGLPL